MRNPLFSTLEPLSINFLTYTFLLNHPTLVFNLPSRLLTSRLTTILLTPQPFCLTTVLFFNHNRVSLPPKPFLQPTLCFNLPTLCL